MLSVEKSNQLPVPDPNLNYMWSTFNESDLKEYPVTMSTWLLTISLHLILLVAPLCWEIIIAPVAERFWVAVQVPCCLREPWQWHRWTAWWWPTSFDRRSVFLSFLDPRMRCRTFWRSSDPSGEMWRPRRRKEHKISKQDSRLHLFPEK